MARTPARGGILQDATAFINAPTVINLGFFDMDGTQENSFVELHADLTLNVDRIDLNDNRFHGALEVTDPARFTVNTPTPWTMAGSLEVAGGPGTRLTVGGAHAILEQDVVVQPLNEIGFVADVSGPGNFSGGGDVFFYGEYSPGDSPALVVGDGDITFDGSSRLLIDIGGTTPVTTYDAIRFQGNAFLDGELEVSLIDLDGGDNPFVPHEGDTFNILLANAGVHDEFDDHLLPFFSPGLRWDVDYKNDHLRLLVVESDTSGDFNRDRQWDCADVNALVEEIATGGQQATFDLNGDAVVDDKDVTWWLAEAGWHNLPSQKPYLWGDATLDGVVDTSDFNAWNANKFASTTDIPGWCQGNFSLDNAVDVSDFNIWNANKFTSADGITMVPEPSAWLLAAACLLLWTRYVTSPSDRREA